MLVTNSKLRDLVPRWAPFHGMSLLFKNPGHSHRPSGALDKLCGESGAGAAAGEDLCAPRCANRAGD